MRIIVICFAFFYASFSIAQVSVGIIAEPTLNLSSIGTLPSSQSDSLKSLRSHDYSLGLGIEIRNQIDRYNSITFIPGYTQTNLLLVKEDLQFLDVIHPQLPEVRDFGQTAEKKAYLRYRQKYIGTQILYAKRLQVNTGDAKLTVELGGGLGAYYLLQDDIRVRTEAFAINNDYTQIIRDSTGIEVQPFLFNGILTGDMNYKILPDLILIGGFKLTLPVTSTTISEPTIRLYNAGLRLGLRHIL